MREVRVKQYEVEYRLLERDSDACDLCERRNQ